MFAHLALFGWAAVFGAGRTSARSAAAQDSYRPHVEVWTTRGEDPYNRGEGVRVFVRADQDAYVTLLRVDTDGRVRVLFPRQPWEDNFVRGGRELEVQGYDSPDLFQVDDYPGVGYLFAVAAADRFAYDAIESGDHWDYRVIADGRVRGDPYVALTDLAQRIVPAGDSAWDYDITPYYVQQHYDYPRFLCYDCHTYAAWPIWNPYSYSCVRFRIVVFDDPYYYPYRYYGGRRATFTRPMRPEPRFIFKDRGGVGDDRFVTRERERPVDDDTRRGVTRRDLGRVLPPPRDLPRRERPGQPGNDPNSGDQGGADRRRGTDRSGQQGHADRPSEGRQPQNPPQGPPPRAEPRREAPRAQPPRAEPHAPPPPPSRREAPARDNGKGKDNQPELRRRKP